MLYNKSTFNTHILCNNSLTICTECGLTSIATVKSGNQLNIPDSLVYDSNKKLSIQQLEMVCTLMSLYPT